MARSDRVSIKLSPYALDRAERATEHADRIGRPFTHFLTIHWHDADGGGTVQERQAHLLIMARRWLERRGCPLVCLWSVEPSNVGATAHHCHTLIHLPRGLVRDFATAMARWTFTELSPDARWKGRKPPKGTIACGINVQHRAPMWLLQRRYDDGDRLLSYVVKARDGQPRNHGRVVGKRLGVSNIIGPRAIRAWQENRAA